MSSYERNDLITRLINFAVSIIKLTAKFPKSTVTKHIASQLLRCGTAPGANYEEARGAESRADFIHKMGIVLKELKESRYWLILIQRSEVFPSQNIDAALHECEQLCAIIAKSIFTAKAKK